MANSHDFTPVVLTAQEKAAKQQTENNLVSTTAAQKTAKRKQKKEEATFNSIKSMKPFATAINTAPYTVGLSHATITTAVITNKVATITWSGTLPSDLSAQSDPRLGNKVFIDGLPSAFNGKFFLKSIDHVTKQLTYSVNASNTNYVTNPPKGTVFANLLKDSDWISLIYGYSHYEDADYVTKLGTSYDKIQTYKESVKTYQKQIDQYYKDLSSIAKGTIPSALGGSTAVSTAVMPKPDHNQVTYNIPSVRESYFKETFNDKNPSYDTVQLITSGGAPVSVLEAAELWSNDKTHKGMIQSFIIPGGSSTNNGIGKATNVTPDAWNKNYPNNGRYAYQFQYNPGVVDMVYAGMQNVDPGLVMSGVNQIPLIGASNTSSSIDFDIIINRMADMKYIRSTNKSDARLSDNYVYGRAVSTDDLQKISDKGTMYDLEFLLQTLLGYKTNSKLRGFTSDVGYMGTFPVELHLGKSLRYIVIINSLTVSHTIFTKDMVPVYTNVHVSAGRMPDVGFNNLITNTTAYQAGVK
jgi:hypothetical protein